MSEVVKGILRAVSSALQVPTIIILILLILLTIVMLGSFVAEIVTERKALKLNIPKLVDDLQGKSTAEMKEVIAASSLLARQKAAAQELISRVTYPDDTREALARQLIADEEARYGKIVKITDLTARVAPMFGLMGTLIPLGPGLIALGEGDAATLSSSLLIAFDTTVAGLISGALSYVVSGIRKGWYEEYMIGLETIMETILDVQNTERRKALQQKKTADAAKAGQTAGRNTITMTKEQLAAVQAAPQSQAAMTHTAPQPAVSQQPQRPGAQAAVPPQPQRPAVPQAATAQPAAPTSQQAMSAARTAAQMTPQGRAAAQAAQAAQTAQAQGRPAAPARPATISPEQPAAQVTRKPSFAEATSKTIAGPASEQLQAEVRAAEEAMRRAEAKVSADAAVAKEMENLQSLDDLLESFAPKDGRL